jgi:hypothetical protein
MAVPFSMILSTHFTGLQQNLGIIASASAALSVASRERECFGRYFLLSRNLLFSKTSAAALVGGFFPRQ